MRIPNTLQSVFVASNRGNDVHKPPPESVAAKTFMRKNMPFLRSDFMNDIDENKQDDDIDTTSVRSVRSGKSSRSIDRSRGRRFFFCRSNSSRRSFGTVASQNSSEGSSRSIAIAQCPQTFLDKMLRSRGYSTKRIKTLDTAYSNQPTPLQQASYGAHLVSLTRAGRVTKVERILRSGGISTNPCNSFGESLIHTICREGDYGMLRMFLRYGASVQVTDDYGRTPLHDACWSATPCFEIIEMILQYDVRLIHMADCRGAVPLSYIRKENWDVWIEWLDSQKDIFWPERDVHNDISGELEQKPPRLAELPPNSCPRPDPENAFTPELAKMVTEGKLEPEEAEYIRQETIEYQSSSFGTDEDSNEDSDEDSDDDDEDDNDDLSESDIEPEYDEDEDDDAHDGAFEVVEIVRTNVESGSLSWDEDEMADLLDALSSHTPVPWTK